MAVPAGDPPSPPRRRPDAPPPPGVRRPAPLQLRPDPPIPILSCAVCRFHDAPSGTCHRHAPMRLSLPGHPDAVWPRVLPDSFCGKYEPPLPGDRPS